MVELRVFTQSLAELTLCKNT